jgi:hypothetical protein
MPTTITYEVILKTEHSDLYGYSENTIATLTVPAKGSGDIGETLRNAVRKAITNKEQLKNDPFLQWLKQQKEKTNDNLHN